MVVLWVSGSGPGRKRNRIHRKTLHTSGVSQFNLGHLCGKDCIMWGFQMFLFLITRGGIVIRMMRSTFLLRTGQGWVNSLGVCLPTSPGLHVP